MYKGDIHLYYIAKTIQNVWFKILLALTSLQYMHAGYTGSQLTDRDVRFLLGRFGCVEFCGPPYQKIQ